VASIFVLITLKVNCLIFIKKEYFLFIDNINNCKRMK